MLWWLSERNDVQPLMKCRPLYSRLFRFLFGTWEYISQICSLSGVLSRTYGWFADPINMVHSFCSCCCNNYFNFSTISAAATVKMNEKSTTTLLTVPKFSVFFNFLHLFFPHPESILPVPKTKVSFALLLLAVKDFIATLLEAERKKDRSSCARGEWKKRNILKNRRRRSLAPPFVYCNLIKIVRPLSYRFIFHPKCFIAATWDTFSAHTSWKATRCSKITTTTTKTKKQSSEVGKNKDQEKDTKYIKLSVCAVKTSCVLFVECSNRSSLGCFFRLLIGGEKWWSEREKRLRKKYNEIIHDTHSSCRKE